MTVGLVLIGTYWLACMTVMLGCFTGSTGVEFVNPSFLYSKLKVNWFGAYFIAIIFNILVLPVAIVYWIYKLCTVGRK